MYQINLIKAYPELWLNENIIIAVATSEHLYTFSSSFLVIAKQRKVSSERLMTCSAHPGSKRQRRGGQPGPALCTVPIVTSITVAVDNLEATGSPAVAT